MIELSVVFGTYNRFAMLKEAVASVRAAVGVLPYELVICDGGSTDGSLEWLRDQTDVQLIEHGELRGAVRAYMDCFAAARGEFVAWINDDMTLAPGTYEAAVAQLRADPKIGMLGVMCATPQGKVRGFSSVKIKEKDYPFAYFGVLRREDGQAVGWFSDNFYHYCGDIWIALKIQSLGKRLVPLEGHIGQHHEADNDFRSGPRFHIGQEDISKFSRIAEEEFMTLGMVEHRELALKLRDLFGIEHFVETGTYKGDTTKWAAEHFKNVTTIEAYKPRYEKTFAALNHLENVEFIFGSSRTKLRRALPKGKAAILWLDAHWCNNYEYSLNTEGECPLIDELKAVRKADCVLIDDARLFLARPHRPHDPAQWPSFGEIRAMLPGRYIVVWEDVIIAVPVEATQLVREVIGYESDPEFLIVASNKYVHCLPATYHLLNEHCGTPQARLLRYDVRPPKPPENIVQCAVGKQANYSWSTGLSVMLASVVQNDKIVMILEDYWITRADMAAVKALWEYMDEHPQVMKIDLSGDLARRACEIHDIVGDVTLVRAAEGVKFRASVQAAIWRRDWLCQHASEHEWNAWQFEKHACNDGTLVLGVVRPLIEYVNAIGGQGNKPGEYDHKKIPAELWSDLAEKGLVS